MLDVVGKVFALIVKQMLQKTAEDVLLESQSGFRKGRGCMHIMLLTMCARQLIEKTIEDEESLYVVIHSSMAPILFNLFFNAVVEAWRTQCAGNGIEIM